MPSCRTALKGLYRSASTFQFPAASPHDHAIARPIRSGNAGSARTDARPEAWPRRSAQPRTCSSNRMNACLTPRFLPIAVNVCRMAASRDRFARSLRSLSR